MLILQIQFFKHFLTWTKTGKLNLDVSFRLEPREQNKILGQIRDLDGLAHFEDEYLSALADGESLQNQLGRLRNGHKIAGHFRVSDCYRAACGNLFLEDWNNTSVASEYIPEAHRNEFCTTLHLECANEQLCCALRNAHHTGWPNRLICGNHGKIVDSVLSRCTGDVPGPENVGFDRSEDVPLHQRNMLVGGCMIHNRRVIVLHHPFQSDTAGDTADLWVKSYVREAFSHLSVNMEKGSLRLIETHNGKRTEGSDLPADLRPDRARSTRHHDNPSLNALPNPVHIKLHGLSTEQILYSNLSDLLAQFRALDKLPQTRHHLVFHLGIGGELQNAHHLRSRRGGNRNEHSLDGVLLHQCFEGLSRSHHPLAIQHEPNFSWIVIDNAYDIAHQGLVLPRLPPQSPSCAPR